ncbi:COP9 signalosome complex subunit 7a [Diorhabda carinulata]|uniref:COP9 signalosome complex subunit 7a n=1 Tax=Diorhabda sublineata TaxID=1163346 RepID=UPI0024E14140|nr:COP9 signalosome complex subunit 7a [Diorhabda sublineata]XP_057670858.1 COP9 signalosome complex subunit 7a [Diorhabda carinulata]
MVVDKSPLSGSVLEQFVILAKCTKGAACAELVKQVLEAPGVYVFGELLDMPNILELATTDKKYFNTLELFAFGTFKDYLANQNEVLELTPAQRKKLQHLTIVTLAMKSKCIPYSTLLLELDIKNVRDLEDLIIEAIYADIIHGKLDQKNSQLEVDYAIGRDIRAEDINIISNCLQDWCSACEGVLSCVENQIRRANSEKNKSMQRKADIENEIVNIKKTLKTQLQERSDGTDEVMATDSRESSSTSGDKGKKSQKMKGLKILR